MKILILLTVKRQTRGAKLRFRGYNAHCNRKHTALQLQHDARYAKRTLARRAAATVTATLLTMVERALALSEEEAGAKGFALAPAAPLLIPRREDAVVGSRGETPIERGATLTLVAMSGPAAMGVTAFAGAF